MAGKAWGDRTQTERYADIIGAKEGQIRVQVEVITRLLAACAMADVPERGTVVRFKLPSELPFPKEPGTMAYLTLDESVVPVVSEVDGEAVITVTLKAMS